MIIILLLFFLIFFFRHLCWYLQNGKLSLQELPDSTLHWRTPLLPSHLQLNSPSQHPRLARNSLTLGISHLLNILCLPSVKSTNPNGFSESVCRIMHLLLDSTLRILDLLLPHYLINLSFLDHNKFSFQKFSMQLWSLQVHTATPHWSQWASQVEFTSSYPMLDRLLRLLRKLFQEFTMQVPWCFHLLRHLCYPLRVLSVRV